MICTPANPPKFILPFVTNSLKDARELRYSGKTIDANTAAEMGLVNRVVPADELDATVDAEVAKIKKTPRTAVPIAKDMINNVQGSQGYSRYDRVDEYVGDLIMESSAPERIREIRNKQGLQAALEWMQETDKP